jgi:hypothetical protein
MKSLRVRLTLIVCLAATMTACRGIPDYVETSSKGASPAKTRQAPSEEKQEEVDLFAQWPEGVPPGLKLAWEELTNTGRYRLAIESDFKFPAGSERVIEPIQWFPRHPYLRILWDINRDGDYNDFIAMVVDTSKSDDARFGLVILSRGKVARKRYQVHWLLRDADFSRTVVTTASSYLSVETLNEDWSRTVCGVTWVRQRYKYNCK